MSRAVGIDLGTTNSCVAIFQQGKPVVIPNPEGTTTTPSMVAIMGGDTRLVGAIAKRQILTNPESTLFSVKRLIGRKYEDPEVRHAREFLSYTVAPAANGDVVIRIGERTFSIPEVQAEILSMMRQIAEAHLGGKVTEAVITVPAYFNDAQRQATKDAGMIAGLKVLRIINEPTAAALAYGLDKTDRRVIAVYDLGGGTFDMSILEIGEGVFQVKATSGDTFLGGDDFDRRVMDFFLEEYRRQEGEDLPRDAVVLQRLRDAAEGAKHILSSEEQTVVNLPFLAITPRGPRHLKVDLTRSRLEELTADLVQRTLEPCRQALADSGLKAENIQEVILVGGQTRMPRIRQAVRDFFGREPRHDLNPDEVVAIGAAVQAAVLTGDFDQVLLLDVTPLSLGLETKGGLFTSFIERNTTVPTRKTLTFTTTEDNQASVTVHILQGERKMAADNISLAKFDLVGLPPAPRGLPKIEVTFDIDANGILSVSARDRGTGQTQAVKVTPSGGLASEEINRIIQEAESARAVDSLRRSLALVRNEAEATVYTAESLVRNYGSQLRAEEKEHCLELIRDLRVLLEKGERQQVEKKNAELKLLTQHMVHNLL